MAQHGGARVPSNPAKACVRCAEVKPPEKFPPTSQGNRRAQCYQCRYSRRKETGEYAATKEVNRLRYAGDPAYRDKIRSRNRKGRMGLSLEEVEAHVQAQGGCAICHADTPGGVGGWHVDHDHSCCPPKRACAECRRGILCSACNVAMGIFKDSVERLNAAADYLKAWEAQVKTRG